MSGSVQSIERAAAILQLLAASSGQVTLADVSGSLNLAKPTAHGILRTLHDVGFVQQDRATGRYALGPALLHLGSSYLDANELRARALNWADSLASRTGEAVHIGRLSNRQVLLVHHVFRPDDSQQVLEVGALLPPHATALGKVLLAYSPGAVRELPIGERFTRRTASSTRALAQELTAVRAVGWAAEAEELLVGRAGIAAPLRGQGGLMVGAIGITGAVDRICDAHGSPHRWLVGCVLDAAHEISHDLAAGRR